MRWKVPRYASKHTLLVPYGDSGRTGWSSSAGITSGSPYSAPPVELKMTFLAPASTLAFSTLSPPTTFTMASKPGSATDLGTSDCAA